MDLSSNVLKISLQNYLGKYTENYNDTLDKLSSGVKYSSIQDDPVSYSKTCVIDKELTANKNLASNLEIGQDLLVAAESNQEEVLSAVTNIKDLCTQALNGTYSDDDKNTIISEIQSQLEYINSIAESANFNGTNLLDGSCTSLQFQLSSTSGDTIDVGDSLLDVHTNALDISLDSSTSATNWTNEDINTYMENLDLAYNSLLTSNIKVGAYSTRLGDAADRLTGLSENLTEARSVITDTDVAEASSDAVRYQILQESAVTILAQANQMISSVLSLLPDN